MEITSYSCHILMKLEFSRQAFEKYSNIKFHEKPSIGSRVVPCRQTDTDRHDEANSRYFVILRKLQESTNSFHFARFEVLRAV
jgi:hypothetical protein